MDDLWQEIRRVGRNLATRPGLATTVIMMFALGIGVNTAVFSVLNTVVLRPLPYDPQNRIVTFSQMSTRGTERRRISALSLRQFQECSEAKSFDALATYSQTSAVLAGVDQPIRMSGALASPQLFQVMRAEPLLGRRFMSEEATSSQPGTVGVTRGQPVLALSHNAWQGLFDSDVDILGQKATLDGITYTIVAIMPPHLRFPDKETDFWVPLALNAPPEGLAVSIMIPVVGRLKNGVTIDQAEAEGNAIISRLPTDQAAGSASVRVISLKESIVGDARASLVFLEGAVGLVLLIATSNVASLVAYRFAGRRREFAIRLALGGGRPDVVRVMFVECVVLAIAGGAVGLLFCQWSARWLATFGPATFPRVDELTLDYGVLCFAGAVSVLCGLLVALIPAVRAFRTDLTQSLKETGPHWRTARLRELTGGRVQNLLITFQVVVAFVLLITATLLTKGLVGLLGTTTGYDANNLLTARIDLPSSVYSDAAAQVFFYNQLLDRVSELRGVDSLAIVNHLPLTPGRLRLSASIGARGESGDDPKAAADVRIVSSGYFTTMGIRLLQGRVVNDADTHTRPTVAVINEALARQYLSGKGAVGSTLRIGASATPCEIVGIVSDVRHGDLRADPVAEVYLAYRQLPQFREFERGGASARMFLAVRSNGDLARLLPGIRAQVLSVDRALPIYNVMTMNERLSASVARPRFDTAIVGSFSLLGLTLAVVGIAALTANSVAERTGEMAVRIVLGVQPLRVLIMSVKQSLVSVSVGLALGIPCSFALIHLMRRQLYDLARLDGWTVLYVSIVFLGVVTVVSYFPARRATRVDPMAALRYE